MVMIVIPCALGAYFIMRRMILTARHLMNKRAFALYLAKAMRKSTR